MKFAAATPPVQRRRQEAAKRVHCPQQLQHAETVGVSGGTTKLRPLLFASITALAAAATGPAPHVQSTALSSRSCNTSNRSLACNMACQHKMRDALH